MPRRKKKSIFDEIPFPSLGNNAPKRDKRRAFTRTQEKEILWQQDNKCAICHEKLDPRTTEFDHKKPWAAGGRTITQNGRAVHPNCHRLVTHKRRLKKTNKPRKTHGERIAERLSRL